MERKYKRVMLVGSDGCGIFFRQANTPNMDRIFANGAVTYSAVTAFPSISAECWGSMLHGVAPEYHGLTNTIAGTVAYNNSEYPSVFRIIREHYPEAKLASFCGWRSINKGIIESEIGVEKFSDGHDDVVKDKVVSYINENDFDFIFVQFDSTDTAGHKGGYGSEQHLNQISIIDSYIGEIYDALIARNMAEDTLIIVSTDHGGLPIQVHGGDSDEEMTIFIGVAGNGVINGEMFNEGGISVRDISAIVLHAMGIDVPQNMDAAVPQKLFVGYEPEKNERRKANPVQKEYNRPLFDENETLESAIKAGKVRSIMRFDGNIEDSLGNAQPAAVGELKFVDTENGKAIDLSECFVSMGLYKLGMDNFSISFNIKLNESDDRAFLVSNRDSSDEKSPGFSFVTTKEGIRFEAGNGKMGTACMNTFHAYEKPSAGGWRHITLTLNHRAQGVVVYSDFEKIEDQLFDSNLQLSTFDNIDVCIGSDGAGKYEKPLNAYVKDFMFFNGNITRADMPVLKKLYEELCSEKRTM